MANSYLGQLADSLIEVLEKMTGVSASWQAIEPKMPSITSGIVFISLIGFTGLNKGRVVMEMDVDTGHQLAEAMNQENLKVFDTLVFQSLTELSNIFCGKGITKINNGPGRPGLRLTPPNILVGEDIDIFGNNKDLRTALINWHEVNMYIHLSIERG